MFLEKLFSLRLTFSCEYDGYSQLSIPSAICLPSPMGGACLVSTSLNVAEIAAITIDELRTFSWQLLPLRFKMVCGTV